jgi:hypothetical protein
LVGIQAVVIIIILQDNLFLQNSPEALKADIPEGGKILPQEKSFLELAMETGTDKVSTHKYNFAYENYLPKLRHSPV